MIYSVNFLAVLAATVAAYAVGALWYTALFSKKWKMLMGFTDDVMKSMKMTPTGAMSGGFVATLLMVFVLANLLAMFSITSVGTALTFAFWIWLGFVATIMSNVVWYENRSWSLYFINASHYFFAILIAAYVLAWWPW